MAGRDEAVEALLGAVRDQPDNVGLRLHVARILAERDRWDEALRHCAHAIGIEPDNPEGLRLGVTLAAAANDGRRGAAYRRLADRLGVAVDEQLKGDPTRVAASDKSTTSMPSQDDIDEFFDELLGAGARRPRVTLDDVGGLDDVKRRLRSSFLVPMEHADLRSRYGKSLRGGLLLWGPPGCGKTYLARAVAGEMGARFVSVGLHDVLDMYLGNSEKNLHGLFEMARREQPCVLFFDEIDALGFDRNKIGGAPSRNAAAQLLAELDGVRDDNEGVFVLGATNQLWDVDPALRRPGRFDRALLVLPPDEPARVVILQHHLRGREHAAIDYVSVVRRTQGYTGADLGLVCDSAAELALEEALETGDPRPISTEHLLRSVTQTRPSSGAWLESARNYVKYANDDGSLDELGAYLRHRGT